MMEQSSLVDAMLDHRNDLSDVKSVDSVFSSDSGVMATSEIFENDLQSITTEKLFNELQRVKEDLQSKDSEIRRANEIRENTNREIEDLTVSLFETAHSMVEQAKYAQANAEQKLQIKHLENSQLKKTVNELKQILNTCRLSFNMSTTNNSIDNILFREFTYISPCLTFPNANLSSRVLAAIERNDIVMETYNSKGNMNVFIRFTLAQLRRVSSLVKRFVTAFKSSTLTPNSVTQGMNVFVSFRNCST
ncbi:unnamed protein product [Rotaria sordida]|uniref:GDP/GTP exchange factor Sec2 N-terminal domain-containing protein n=1 Tax=Rotaria sordida TaxID=392033 RepID=A0A815TMV0_9BILA|nr:unnamed protein product [Rotaria sordida]